MATKKEEQPSPAPQPIAEDSTMTAYGITVGDIVTERDAMQRDRNQAQELAAASAEREASLREQVSVLEQTSAENSATIAAQMARLQEMEEAAAVNAETIAELSRPPAKPTPEQFGAALAGTGLMNSDGFQRLSNGGLRVTLTVDVDTATPLLSWAQGAGEDPQTYIQRTLEDALVAVVSS